MASVNAVVGDASYLARYGRRPRASDLDCLRIRVHLEWVEESLRAADVAHLHPAARERRAWLLRELRSYAARERFPRNVYSRQRRPVFIDHEGRICAVGHLMEVSVGRGLPHRIASTHRLALVRAVDLPELNDWAVTHGFSLHELAMIQPQYPWSGGDPARLPEDVVRLVPAMTVFCLAALFTAGAVQLVRGWQRSRPAGWPRWALFRMPLLRLGLLVMVLGYASVLWRETLAIVPLRTRTERGTWCSGTLEMEQYRPKAAWLTKYMFQLYAPTTTETAIAIRSISEADVRHGLTRFRYLDGTVQSGYYLLGHHVFGANLKEIPPCPPR